MVKKKWQSFFSFSDFRHSPLPLSAYFAALPRLEGQRLMLRPFQRRDSRDVFAYASDPEVARYVLWEPHTRLSESRDYIRYNLSLYRSGQPGSWAIVHGESGRVIGSIGFVWVSRENRSCEVGYSLSRAFWNQGLMSEALSLVIASVFADLPLDRIEAQCDLRNPASARVMEKSGMFREGVLRRRLWNKGEPVDVALYAILRQDLD